MAEDLAALLMVYVDDMRTVANSDAECWELMHQVSSRVQYLGIQVALRKIRPPSQRPGAWAGSVVDASQGGVAVRCTQEKWDKAKGLLVALAASLTSKAPLCRKTLESTRGFLVHVQHTYPSIIPYLKGLHLTIDSWRSGRDADGWKQHSAQTGVWDEAQNCWCPWVADDANMAPSTVHAVPRLATDVASLQVLFSAPSPPLRFVRSPKITTVTYGFGDASGAGFGSSMTTSDCLHVRHGVWGSQDDASSSNYRELANLVDTISTGLQANQLQGSEIFLFTDNSTAESVFFKGTSKSKRLFDLILSLRQLEMNNPIKLHFIHVAGKRMIQQGTDGISRGDLTEGVMKGDSMLQHVPLHLDVFARQPDVLAWVQYWSDQPTLQPLTPDDWYERGQGFCGGTKVRHRMWTPSPIDDEWLLWSPPPAAASVALRALTESRHKHKHFNHIFIVPRLMTYMWRKRLQRCADFVFELPPGARSIWPQSECEPLIIGIVLRFSISSPWQVRESTLLLDMDRQLRQLWMSEDGDERPILRQLCQSPRVLDRL